MYQDVKVYVKIISSLTEEDDLNPGKYKVTVPVSYCSDSECKHEVARSTEILRGVALDYLSLPKLYASVCSKFSA